LIKCLSLRHINILTPDFLGGEGAYEELLKCFERVGIKLRPELDEYFSRFNDQL